MIDKQLNRKKVDNNKVFGAILTDLTNAFNCICHKLATCLWTVTSNFEKDSRLPPKSKSKNKNWIFIQYMVENCFLNDLAQDPSCLISFHVTQFWNMKVIVSLITQTILLPMWFKKTKETIKKQTIQFQQQRISLISPKNYLFGSLAIKLKYILVNVTYCQARKRKQTTNNNNLKFELRIENICQKANRKLNALARRANYMELPKKRMFMNAFLKLNLIIALLFGCFTLVP